jgi:hypothetical protein
MTIVCQRWRLKRARVVAKRPPAVRVRRRMAWR